MKEGGSGEEEVVGRMPMLGVGDGRDGNVVVGGGSV